MTSGSERAANLLQELDGLIVVLVEIQIGWGKYRDILKSYSFGLSYALAQLFTFDFLTPAVLKFEQPVPSEPISPASV